MLSRLLRVFGLGKRAWEDADPQVRRGALAALCESVDGRARLPQIAAADPDASVRDAALQLIDDPAALFSLCERENARPIALRRLAALAAAGHAESILRARPDLGRALLISAQDQTLADSLLAVIVAPAELLQIAEQAESPQTRLAAALRIDEEPLLQQLERSSRTADKRVHRHARNQLDARRALRAETERLLAAFGSLHERARHLHHAAHEPQLDARLELLQRAFGQWHDERDALQARQDAMPGSTRLEVDEDDLALTLGDLVTRAEQQRLRAHEQAAAAAQAIAQVASDAVDANDRQAQSADDRAAHAADKRGAQAADDRDEAADEAADEEEEDEDSLNERRREQRAALRELQTVHDDVVQSGAALLDRLALVSPALTLIERRWSGATRANDPPSAESLAYLPLWRLLRDGAGAAQRVEQNAARVDELVRRIDSAAAPTDSATPAQQRLPLAGAIVPARMHDEEHDENQADDTGSSEGAPSVEGAAARDSATTDVALPARNAPTEQWAQFWRRQQQARAALGDVDALLRQLQWPSALPQPAPLHALSAAAERARGFLRAGLQAQATLLPHAEAALTALAAVADAGQLRAAQQQLSNTRRVLRALPSGAAQPLQMRLAALAARVQELRDWQGYATQPKREDLCARITALADSLAETAAGDPEALADQIKSLRAEWQALGVPGSAAEHALADTFNAAAERAFEPCKAYFETLGRARARNLGERERVLTTLTEYLEHTDWQHADWKFAQQVLRVAREEFMSFSPIERTAGREQGKRFDAAADRLHGLIKAELDANLQAKQAIVAAAAALAGADVQADELQASGGQATDEQIELRIASAKRLQQDWRRIGITPRGPDQKLWRIFRAHCDAVFAARERAREAQAATAVSDAERAEAIVEALEARLQDDTPITDDVLLQQQLEAFDALFTPNLAKDRGRLLGRRMRAAEQAYLQRLQMHQQQGRRQHYLRWLELHDALLDCEQQSTASGAATAQWPEALFEGARPVIDARRARALDGAPAASTGVRHWTLYAEVLAGRESPPEDQAARLQLQVGRLSSSLGQRNDIRLQMLEVLQHWVAAASTAPASERARMHASLDAYLD